MNPDLRTQFLAEYSQELSTRLDAKTAYEEAREAECHLDELIKANLELGDSPDEAAANAIAQFGRSKEIGRQVSNAVRQTEPSKLVFWFAISFLSFLVSFGVIFALDHLCWLLKYYTYSFVETDLKIAGFMTLIYGGIFAASGRHRRQGALFAAMAVVLFLCYWFVPQMEVLGFGLQSWSYFGFGALLVFIPLGVLLLLLRKLETPLKRFLVLR